MKAAYTDDGATGYAFGRFLFVSAAFHVAVVGLLVSFVIDGKTITPPSIYTISIVEAPGPKAAFDGRLPAVKTSPRETLRMEEAPPPAVGKRETAAEGSSLSPVIGREDVPSALGKHSGISEEAQPAGSGNRPVDIFDSAAVMQGAHIEKPLDREHTITFDTSEYMYRNYMNRLRDTVEDIWEYPRDAAEKGVYGDLYIRFVIRKDGSLGSVKVTRISGHQELDSAAVKALRDAEPFIWPLPEDWGASSITIDGHFLYTLYGPQIK
jgi:protein TonB